MKYPKAEAGQTEAAINILGGWEAFKALLAGELEVRPKDPAKKMPNAKFIAAYPEFVDDLNFFRGWGPYEPKKGDGPGFITEVCHLTGQVVNLTSYAIQQARLEHPFAGSSYKEDFLIRIDSLILRLARFNAKNGRKETLLGLDSLKIEIQKGNTVDILGQALMVVTRVDTIVELLDKLVGNH